MTEKDEELLLEDLCSRLLHNVLISIDGKNEPEILYSIDTFKPKVSFSTTRCRHVYIEHIKPYLRPMSSMSNNEVKELTCLSGGIPDIDYIYIPFTDMPYKGFGVITKWLNKHYFDYRGLIPMGLALEASKDMYNLLLVK